MSNKCGRNVLNCFKLNSFKCTLIGWLNAIYLIKRQNAIQIMNNAELQMQRLLDNNKSSLLRLMADSYAQFWQNIQSGKGYAEQHL